MVRPYVFGFFLSLPDVLMTACTPDSVSSNHLALGLSSLPAATGAGRESTQLVAVVEPQTGRLQATNPRFCQLMGITDHKDAPCLGDIRASESDLGRLQQRLKAQLLHQLLRQRYQFQVPLRSLSQPVIISLDNPPQSETRYVEFYMRPHGLVMDSDLSHPCPLDHLSLTAIPQDQQRSLANDSRWLTRLMQQLQGADYVIEGNLVLEGVDVTARERIRRIIELLINYDSIRNGQSFEQLNVQMCQLFRAENTIIAGIEGDTVRIFKGSISEEVDAIESSLTELKGQPIVTAIETDQVVTVPDLTQLPPTPGSQQMIAMGTRSALLMPLIADVLVAGQRVRNPIGTVVVLSNQLHHFDGVDCHRAEQLIPSFTLALTHAMRQVQQRQFTNNIHPAVEWRFSQEAERRSWGLPPQPIVFSDVYPLYGVSDIRGSSHERNCAIQADLLAQFELAIAVVDAAYAASGHALCRQMQLDLQEKMAALREGVTVDMEVTTVQYLQDVVEANFDYFLQCGKAACEAVAAYQDACHEALGTIHDARDRYDTLLHQFNTQLRQVWDGWQTHMQAIIPHYCDVETTDGIDHMIYAGASINAKFSPFHLKSLRYEQLRGICHCARRAYEIQTEFDTALEMTHLVLVQDLTVDIFHDERTDRPFEVRGTRDTRYEIVKKRIDKAVDHKTRDRITQPGELTVVYSTGSERQEYEEYLRYLRREGWVGNTIESGTVEPLQGVTGLKYLRVPVLPKQGEGQ
ncbi:MAG: GAF domain-containing protein [Cyanobacteria bacterium P01_A01_bin.135]